MAEDKTQKEIDRYLRYVDRLVEECLCSMHNSMVQFLTAEEYHKVKCKNHLKSQLVIRLTRHMLLWARFDEMPKHYNECTKNSLLQLIELALKQKS